MRPRSLPWLLLRIAVIVLGCVQLVAAINALPDALDSAYGQGGLAGRLIWVALAILVGRQLLREYGDGGSTTTPTSGSHAYVPVPMQATALPSRAAAFECDTFIPAPHGMLPPARGSVPPPRR